MPDPENIRKPVIGNEALFRTVFENSRDAIGISLAGKHLLVNPAYLQMFGFSPETDLAGVPVINLIAPESRQQISDYITRRSRGEVIPTHYETRGLRNNGSAFDMEVSVSLYRIDENNMTLVVLRDITERKQAEKALKDGEAKYRRLYNETPVLLHSIDRSGIVVDVNDYWLKTLGYGRDEVIGKKVTDFYTPASRKYAEEVIQPAFFRNGLVKDISYQFVRKNGELVDVLLSATGERDADGNVIRSQAVIVDVSEQKRAEKMLRVGEEKYRSLFDNSEIAMFRTRLDGSEILDVNQKWLDLVGKTREEVLGKPSVIVWEDPKEREKMVRKLLADGSVSDFEFNMLNGQQGIRNCITSLRLYREQGILEGSIADITERKQVEIALKESEARFRAITTTASDAILLMNDKGKIVYWNPAAERIFGYSAEEAMGRDLHEFLAPQRMYQSYQKGFAQFVNTGQGPVVNRSVEMDAKKKDGTEFPIEVSTSAMNIGGSWHALGIVRDISERKRLEQELIKTQKLESVGTLAGGIAHDFNNLLQGIFGYISLAKISIDRKDKALAMLDQAEKALRQSVNLTTQLLTFSKGGSPLKKVFSLRPVIENAILFSLSGSKIDHILQIDDTILAIDADEGQISQVIQNIVLNAEQSMPLGGRIIISARNVQGLNIPSIPGSSENDFVEISVQDQGIGIPPEHLSRIFDPYFTTKEKGSGLGLATSYSIVRNHGGTIQVSSELGKGSIFTLYLPSSHASSGEQTALPPDHSHKKKGRILVMDDEKIVREVAGALISSLGHDVEFAEHGDAAISQYRAAIDAGRPFDVVVLDLTIRGGMGGMETVQKLIQIDPKVKAVVSSGYSDDASMSDYQSKGFKGFLKKPYNIQDLSNTLNDMFASG